MTPTYPDVEVALVGEDGNAFAIIGRVSKALKSAGYPDAAAEFRVAAFASSSYDDLLALTMQTVEVA
jgi:hypothetical protein